MSPLPLKASGDGVMAGSESPATWVGKSTRRKEDARLLTGRGRFIGDIRAEGMLHLVFVRSMHAHARIVSIDTAAAEAMPGVVEVLTGDRIRHVIKSLPIDVVTPNFDANYPVFWPLAVDKVKFHGEPVAAIVAEDKYLAEDAAEMVEITYEALAPVLDMEEALKSNAPIVHEGWKSNLMFAMSLTGGATDESRAENKAAVAAAFEACDLVVRERFRTHRCGVTPMEPRGALASFDDVDGLHVWLTTQRPHIDRLAFSDLFDIPANLVHVDTPRDQGGAFGVKAPFYREPILVAHMAIKLGRPVRWLESREEHLMSVSQERDQIHDVEAAVTQDGRITALRVQVTGDAGDGCEGVYWGWVMPFRGTALLTNAYDLPLCDISVRVAVTNKAVLSPARAFGTYAGRFCIERLMDLIANRVGRDPVDVRRLNLIQAFPHVTSMGVYYDSGDFNKVFDRLLEAVDYAGFRSRQREALAQGRHLGIGFGFGAEMSGVASEVLVPMENQPGFGAALVRIDPRAKVLVVEGDAPAGQGHETTYAQAVADEFGISPDDITVQYGRTGSSPFGSGTVGARAGSYTVSAIVNACRILKSKIEAVMAHDMGLDAADNRFVYRGGEIVSVRNANVRRTFREMVERIIMKPLNLPPGMEAGLEQTSFFEAAKPMICFSAHAALVEVDVATGQFTIDRYVTCEDVGTIINPQIVEGQVQGGVVQGISNCLFEEFVYDKSGQQMTNTFESYKMATAADVPDIEVNHAGTPSPHTTLGSRGLGEGIPGAVPGACTNAVCDALRPFGVEILTLPLRPDRLWTMLRTAGASPPIVPALQREPALLD